MSAALSPLDANANLKVRQPMPKPKAPAPKSLSREKDHPPPPPSEVHEPPSSDRRHGAVYKMGKLLGKGGFAICHEGVLAGTRQKYALKIVKSVMPQKKMEQKFQTELQIHSKMKHSNIVQFHRAFTFQQSTFIVLELCPNGSLMDMVKKRRFISEPEVRFYTIQIAGAIKYMHAKGIIHRDLKMGNIFLDKDMNVKIGDFGLAALLMSGKDMTAVRRTTLCGTPNYIAPEILEKGKKGHDHAVDIWSLGIIIFAMLTGRPPFQSTTQEEIYRKAREREYDWPENSESRSICQEAKDLVSILLQSPEERPDCDTIVQHPFFSCGWVPQASEMSTKFKETAPDPWLFSSVGARNGGANIFIRNLKALCTKSDVGPWVKGKKVYHSTYREVAAEEKAGLTPAVPLPDDVVYRPFDEVLQEMTASQAGEKSNLMDQDEPEQAALPVQSLRPMSTSGRTIPQSFAAQQRAQHQPATVSAPPKNRRSRPELDIDLQRLDMHDNAMENGSGRSEARVTSRHAKYAPKEQNTPMEDAPMSRDARLSADLVQQFGRQSLDEPQVPRTASLFGPREKVELISGTKPDDVLQKLLQFYGEIERSLNARSLGPVRETPNKDPTIVVKWVDYTNKFGLGYILSTGSVGCIFKSLPINSDPQSSVVPPTCILVPDAERHLQNRNNERYVDRHQLVPVSGAKIEFYQNNGADGMSRVRINPRHFAVEVGPNGESGKLSRGKDEYEDRKREKIVLWKKFANYMTAFGRDHEAFDDSQKRFALDPRDADSNVVTFYQRFGDVGCWVFCDGHFQFNFPDHTKIVISADGTWCDFYHLSMDAANDLSLKGTLPPSALDDRQRLSYPLQALLNFMSKPTMRNGKPTVRRGGMEIDPLIQGIPSANDFRRKIEFIRSIVYEWISNGGIGCSDMTPEGRLKWLGDRELVNVKVPYKHVWVTVGSKAGDERRVAWFDPKRPSEVVQDIEVA